LKKQNSANLQAKMQHGTYADDSAKKEWAKQKTM
jgi:hypothetical protein